MKLKTYVSPVPTYYQNADATLIFEVLSRNWPIGQATPALGNVHTTSGFLVFVLLFVFELTAHMKQMYGQK